MLLLKLEEKSRKPKYQQILEQIRQKIERRTLRPEEKLPSTRRLAERLGAHRSTVAIAYQELWALGFVDLRPGACPRVRERMQIATPARRTSKGAVKWGEIASVSSDLMWQAYLRLDPRRNIASESSLINFSSLDMDRRLFPLESFRSCLNQALKKHGPSLLAYGNAAGFPPLRDYLAHRLQSHGVSVGSDEILITNGSQQGLDLVFRMTASPGKAVAIESPTYSLVLPLLRYWGFNPLEIPIRQDGMDLSVLRDAIQKERPVLIYTMPNFQNPSGVSTSQAHREQLLSLCEANRIPILEDGFEEEMKYFGRVVLPIKSMDKHQIVIYCGTFSKVLFPGVRIGWIAAERECIERLTAIRRFSELSPSMILQAGIHEFCQGGYYDRHISKMHRHFRKRMQAATRALHQHISRDWAEWTEPSGGFLIWLKLKRPPSRSLDWRSLLAAHGVQVAPGGQFFFSETSDTYLRLSISTLDEDQILEGVRRLARAMSHAFTRRKQ